MQDVNNDMDDLFRKAAEQYPLKTQGADWKKVLAGLQDTDATMPAADKKEKRKKRALWLFLLLPFALLCTIWYYGSERGNKQLVTNKENLQEKKSNNENHTNDNTAVKKLSETTGQKIKNTTGTIEKKINNTIADKADGVTKSSNNIISYFPVRKTNKVSNADKPNLYIDNSKNINNNKDNSITTSLPVAGNITTVPSDQIISKNKTVDDNNKNNSNERQPGESSDRIQNTIAGNSKKENTNDILAKQNEADSNNLDVNKEDSSVAKNVADNNKKAGNIKLQTRHQQGFYGGLSGSFDISTIKLQRINKTGYSLNILVGYRFSKRLSVETGLGWNMKNYYSVGKYFDKTKTGIPAAVKIYFTNGDCKMFEIPVNVKYDFAMHKKSNLFATAGLSSYFMKKENYSYHAILGTWIYDTTKHYTNSGANWFSVANFSIGYQVQLNKNSVLRIEPYIKVPLRGIGIANMPITSTGISVGFTRRF